MYGDQIMFFLMMSCMCKSFQMQNKTVSLHQFAVHLPYKLHPRRTWTIMTWPPSSPQNRRDTGYFWDGWRVGWELSLGSTQQSIMIFTNNFPGLTQLQLSIFHPSNCLLCPSLNFTDHKQSDQSVIMSGKSYLPGKGNNHSTGVRGSSSSA